MWPRSLNTESKGRGSEPGAHIITPFYCEELGQFILVNRGWVPKRKMDPATRKNGQVEKLNTMSCKLAINYITVNHENLYF